MFILAYFMNMSNVYHIFLFLDRMIDFIEKTFTILVIKRYFEGVKYGIISRNTISRLF